MKASQTPHKDHSRSSDLVNRQSHLKKTQKISKRSLNGLFTSVSEGVSSDVAQESSDVSQISEITGDHHDTLVKENSPWPLSPAFSASSETFPPSDVTPLSKVTAVTNIGGDVSVERFEFKESDGSLLKTDIVVNLLSQARTEVLNSTDVDFRSKKLLDALIELVINEYDSPPGEKDRYPQLVSVKVRIVFLCFLLWSVAALGIFFLCKGLNHSYSGPSPT